MDNSVKNTKEKNLERIADALEKLSKKFEVLEKIDHNLEEINCEITRIRRSQQGLSMDFD